MASSDEVDLMRMMNVVASAPWMPPIATELYEYLLPLTQQAARIHTGAFKHSSMLAGVSKQCPKLIFADVNEDDWNASYAFADWAPQDIRA